MYYAVLIAVLNTFSAGEWGADRLWCEDRDENTSQGSLSVTPHRFLPSKSLTRSSFIAMKPDRNVFITNSATELRSMHTYLLKIRGPGETNPTPKRHSFTCRYPPIMKPVPVLIFSSAHANHPRHVAIPHKLRFPNLFANRGI